MGVFTSPRVTSSLAVHGPVSGPSTLVAGIPLAIEAPSEATSPPSAKKSTTSTKTLPFQLELLHVQLKHMQEKINITLDKCGFMCLRMMKNWMHGSDSWDRGILKG